MIRVLLVDDQDLVRTGFRMILQGEPEIEVVGEAADGAHAVELAARRAPNVVLIDVRMPGVDGLNATRRIRALPDIDARVLMLTTFDLDRYVYAALRPAPAASCSETSAPKTSSPQSKSWRRARRCSLRA